MARNDHMPAAPGRRLKRWLVLLAALALLWLGGALVYIDQVEHLPAPSAQRTDAIVVLTGGTARLATALRLLNDDKAERLLVSGVGATVTKASLLQALLPTMPDAAQASTGWQGIDLQMLFECCVDLGFEAADTAGNALETAGWLNAHDYKSIRLVTANYHMPRSLVEFSRRLPGITIVPHPVQPDAMRVADWWQRRQAAGFLLGEYTKYGVALIRARLDAMIAAALGENGIAAPVEPAAPAPANQPVQTSKPPAETAPAPAPAPQPTPSSATEPQPTTEPAAQAEAKPAVAEPGETKPAETQQSTPAPTAPSAAYPPAGGQVPAAPAPAGQAAGKAD